MRMLQINPYLNKVINLIFNPFGNPITNQVACEHGPEAIPLVLITEYVSRTTCVAA